MLEQVIKFKDNDKHTLPPHCRLTWKNLIIYNDSNKWVDLIKEGDLFYAKTEEGKASLRIMEIE